MRITTDSGRRTWPFIKFRIARTCGGPEAASRFLRLMSAACSRQALICVWELGIVVRQAGVLWLAAIASMLAIALSSDAQSQRRPPNQNETQRAQQLPAIDQRGTSEAPLVVKVLPTDDAEEKSKQEAADRDAKHQLDTNTFRLGIVTVAVAFLQVVAIGLQALFLWLAFRATTIAAEAARDSANSSVRAQRPYLYITGIEFVAGEAVGATYRIENIGNTPAILQKSSTEIRCLAVLPISPDYSAQRTWPDRIVYSREVIAGMTCTVPTNEKTLLGAAGFTPYFYGYFVFLDAFGKTRRTGFCYAFGGDKAFSRVGGPAYNYDIEVF